MSWGQYISEPSYTCPPAESQLGYEFIDNGYLYVLGCNTHDVLRVGNVMDPASIKIYIGNNSNVAYDIGVINRADPTFYITRTDASTPSFYIRGSDGNIGIGTSQPAFTLDVWGTMRVANLISDNISLSNVQEGTNNSFSTSNVILNNIISLSGSNGYIDISNTTLCNVENIVINSNVTTHDLVVHDSAYVGGDLEVHGFYRHVMGKMQTVYGSIGQIMYNSSNLTELGFIVSWSNSVVDTYELVEVTSGLYGVGCDTRFSLDYKKYVNPNDDPPTYPGEDFSSSINQYKTANVVALQPHVIRHTSNSVRVGAQWRLIDAVQHSASMNLNVFAPTSLGRIGLTGYQIISDLLYTYDFGSDTFVNPITYDNDTTVFTQSSYIYGLYRQVLGNLQKTCVALYSDTNNSELGFVLSWTAASINDAIFIKGRTFSKHGASAFEKWINITSSPFNDIVTTIYESLVGSSKIVVKRLSATTMSIGITQNITEAIDKTYIALDILAPIGFGYITCSGYRIFNNTTQYYDDTTNTFSLALPKYLSFRNILGVMRNQVGYMQTIDVCLGDVAFTTSVNNELGFIISWSENCYHNMFEIDGTFMTIGLTPSTARAAASYTSFVRIDDQDITPDYESFKSIHKTDDFTSLNTFVTKYSDHSAKVTIRWSTIPALQHTAHLAIRITAPQDMGSIQITGIKVANADIYMYNQVTNTFVNVASPLYLMTDSSDNGGITVGVVRHIVNDVQHVTVTYGNLLFTSSGENRIGLRVSWQNTIAEKQIYASGMVSVFGSTTRIALDYNNIITMPDIQNSTTIYLNKIESDNVLQPMSCVLQNTSDTSFETYAKWGISGTDAHHASLRMEFVAPLSLGDLQITGFYQNGPNL